jgi:hypothetical protein
MYVFCCLRKLVSHRICLDTVDERTPLSAILWREASRNVAFLDGWHIETLGPNQERVNPTLDTEVKDLEPHGGERVVYLMEGNPPLNS